MATLRLLARCRTLLGHVQARSYSSINTPEKAAPCNSLDFFGVNKLFTVEDLFDNRVHLGHTVRSLEPTMRDFVYGERFGTVIFDLDQTAVLLRQALNFLAHVAYAGGIILFVARQPQVVHIVERTAIECRQYAHCRPWQREVLSDSSNLFKQEVRLPDVIVILSTKDGIKYNVHGAVHDAAMHGIPTVGIVDSDCVPNIITYPIPGNDDTLESIQLYLHLFKQAILLGMKHREQDKQNEATDSTLPSQ